MKIASIFEVEKTISIRRSITVSDLFLLYNERELNFAAVLMDEKHLRHSL